MISIQAPDQRRFNWTALFVVAVFVWFYMDFFKVFKKSISGICPEGYALSDWLINYEGGFVRRGLAGSLFRAFSGQEYLYPTINVVIHVVGLVITLVIFTFMLRRSWKLSIGSAAIFMLNPSGLSLIFSGVYYRKEMMFHVVTLFHLAIITFVINKRNSDKFTYNISMSALSLLGCAMALTHESYIFLSVPVNYLLSLYFYSLSSGNTVGKKDHLHAFLLQLAPITACIIAFVSKGDATIGQAIWRSLSFKDISQIATWIYIKEIGAWTPQHIHNAINVLSMNRTALIAQQFQLFSTGEIFIWIFLVSISYCYLVGAGKEYVSAVLIDGTEVEHVILRRKICLGLCLLLFVLFFCSLPLYLLAIDYGRWLSSVVVTYIIVLLVKPDVIAFVPNMLGKNKFSIAFQRKIEAFDSIILSKLWPVARKDTLKYMLLIFWVGFISIGICGQTVSSTFMGPVAKLMTKFTAWM
jgi:hypothetical protein